ncbi:MAG: amidohydrolase [Bacteroidales bacterium]
MRHDITVSLIQSAVIWEKPADNLELFARLLEEIKGKTDLVILPEMFTTGFSMECEKLSGKYTGKTLQWMEKWAKAIEGVIAGSIIFKEKDKYYNRLIWMTPDSGYKYYNKRHLFRMENEHQHYTGGKNKLIVNLSGWNICPLICYDLRFPVWSRNRFTNSRWEYDILIYIANWPSERNDIWSTLLKARAIENQAYVIGVNRTGTDGNNISHSGNSVVIDLNGNIIDSCGEKDPCVKTIKLSVADLAKKRRILEAGKDWDSFEITGRYQGPGTDGYI